MGIFKEKPGEGKLNPLIIEDFFNKTQDIFIIMDYDGNIEAMNQQNKKDEYASLVSFFEGNSNKQVYDDMIGQVRKNGVFSKELEINKDDSIIRIHITGIDVTEFNKMVFYVSDITNNMHRETELLRKLEEQGELLKSKDLFIANLSHEIKTPMNIIVGMIYFLKTTKLDEKQLEYMNKLDEASQLLLEMTSGVLTLSQDTRYVSTNFLTDFNMKEYLTNLVENFTPKATAKGIQLYTDFEIDDSIDICADKSKINEVFVNLMDNAIKYTERGYVEISAKKVEENNVSYRLQFCLKDTGIGIKQEDSLKIFREFSQVEDPTKKEKEGKGIGLAVVKKIIEDMNGKIWVESSFGLGSKFYFNIKVDKCNKELKDIVNHEIVQQTGFEIGSFVDNKDVKILLVEDNTMNIEITKKIIEDEGYQCDVAEDGISCIKKIQQLGNNFFHLILMDIHMPRYNGFEITKILRQDFGVTIPIVALTATSVTEKIKEENKNLITEFILKPILPEKLKMKLRSYFGKGTTLQETEKKKDCILLIADNQDSIEDLKGKLKPNYEVVVATKQIDVEILLQAGTIHTVVIDEFTNIDKEIDIVQYIRCSPNPDVPVILISRKPDSNLKERSYEVKIDGMIQNDEIEQISTAVYNILKKTEEKDTLKLQVEKSKEEIENVYNFLFDSMINLTSARSKETGEHLKRTKEYMKVMLAKYEDFYHENLFTTKETIEDIAMAAVLHDIGKVGIPDNILNKPGKLTDEEYELMKTHTTIGSQILETTYGNQVSNNILKYAKDIVLHHHEKYDGTGYPEHLKGEEISVVCRLMCIVDVYDALANKRVYKPALPYDEIEEYIMGQSGKAFDSKAVNIFSMVKEQLKEINEANKDKENVES